MSKGAEQWKDFFVIWPGKSRLTLHDTQSITAATKSCTAENPENTQRICKAAEGMLPAERRRQAESERHKGNDYFRAHDYRAAVEAFTVAAELDPTSVAARANRAAAYLKLHMWSDAETDACETLRLDPGNLKAQLRRAQARCELGQMSLAQEDALAVLSKVRHCSGTGQQPCLYVSGRCRWRDSV